MFFRGVSTLAILILTLPCVGAEPAAGSFTLDWFDNALTTAQKFRLVFTTSSTTNGESSLGSYYDSVVADDAASGSLTKNAPTGTGWKAIVSTSSGEEAATRTGTTPSSASDVTIFRIDGAKLADDYGDFWDGSIDAPMEVTEDGVTLSGGQRVWTGSDADGTNNRWDELGRSSPVYGQTNQTDEDAFNRDDKDSDRSYRLYGISDVYQWNGQTAMLASQYEVPPPPATVPEPGSFAMFAVLSSLGLVIRRRPRRHAVTA